MKYKLFCVACRGYTNFGTHMSHPRLFKLFESSETLRFHGSDQCVYGEMGTVEDKKWIPECTSGIWAYTMDNLLRYGSKMDAFVPQRGQRVEALDSDQWCKECETVIGDIVIPPGTDFCEFSHGIKAQKVMVYNLRPIVPEFELMLREMCATISDYKPDHVWVTSGGFHHNSDLLTDELAILWRKVHDGSVGGAAKFYKMLDLLKNFPVWFRDAKVAHIVKKEVEAGNVGILWYVKGTIGKYVENAIVEALEKDVRALKFINHEHNTQRIEQAIIRVLEQDPTKIGWLYSSVVSVSISQSIGCLIDGKGELIEHVYFGAAWVKSAELDEIKRPIEEAVLRAIEKDYTLIRLLKPYHVGDSIVNCLHDLIQPQMDSPLYIPDGLWFRTILVKILYTYSIEDVARYISKERLHDLIRTYISWYWNKDYVPASIERIRNAYNLFPDRIAYYVDAINELMDKKYVDDAPDRIVY